ncbi:MAG: RNA-directed DNA polymerase [Candidatus Obscuribacterales bacterium]|nr:RNA-directed DNA polymerase [Candidatus Obscuribacterales bacterium]
MSDLVNLGGFSVPIDRSLTHLRQDLRDDWFPDFLYYEDFLKPAVIVEYILSNVSQNHGMYVPGKHSLFNIPKSHFALRYSLETDIIDRFVYQATTSFLMLRLDSSLSKRVLSHRLETSQSSDRAKYLIRHKIEQWNIFQGITKYSLDDRKTLLITDVQNFFENISVADIRSTFERLLQNSDHGVSEKIEIRCAIETLLRCLKYWSFNGLNGLAQNRDASHFISNVVMSKLDEIMLAHNFDYYRYVDDIRVICEDKYQARRALKILISELRNFGLSTNTQKTIIFDATDHAAVERFFESDNESIDRIDAMFRSRSKFVIARSLPLLAELCQKLIQEQKTQSRAFRFCIERLERLLRCENFDLGAEHFNQIATGVIDALEENAVTSDKFVSFLSACQLSFQNQTRLIEYICDREKTISPWQNFLLWRMFALKDILSPKLQTLAITLVNEEVYSPECNSALVYLAKLYPEKVDSDIWRKLQKNKCFMFQRAVLLSLHERDLHPFYRDIAKACVPSVRGTGRRIKESALKGVYISSPEPFSFHELYDHLSQYE